MYDDDLYTDDDLDNDVGPMYGVSINGQFDAPFIDPYYSDDGPPDISVQSNTWELYTDKEFPLDWMNGAGVSFDSDYDSVTLWISTGDPRGAFTMDVRRLKDGRIIIMPPTVDSMHEDLEPHGSGYVIKRTIPVEVE
jgi:hypothetical protein